MERETAYARNLRMAHEARMSKMNPIQIALYQMKNPSAKPPEDPDPPPKKSIPVSLNTKSSKKARVLNSATGALLHCIRCRNSLSRILCDDDFDVWNDFRSWYVSRLAAHELMAATLTDVANEWLGMAIFTTLNDWLVTKPWAFLKVCRAADHIVLLCQCFGLQAATIFFLLNEFTSEIVEAVETGFEFLKRFLADKCSLDLRWLDVKT